MDTVQYRSVIYYYTFFLWERGRRFLLGHLGVPQNLRSDIGKPPIEGARDSWDIMKLKRSITFYPSWSIEQANVVGAMGVTIAHFGQQGQLRYHLTAMFDII